MSKICLLIGIAIILGTHFLYYPKWDMSKTEATISWDVSGYYMYLPAAFIYKDLKKCEFKDDVLTKYNPTPDFQQAYIHPISGNYVMKYSIGQAVIFTPAFLIAHSWASISSSYPADGFSFPYQFLISMNSIFIAIIGLIILRLILLKYFEETPVGITILAIILGSNYLNYAAIDGAMTHNSLFTIYALLIYTTIKFYEKPKLSMAFIIGLLVGLAALTRPTEIICAMIPVVWGVNLLKNEQITERIAILLENYKSLIMAGLVTAFVGSIQMIYWKYATGEWLVYSYEEQGFSWLRPHLMEGIFSYKSGWLMYSPLMIFSILGFYFLFRNQRKVFFTTFIFSALFIYIAFAWDIWWYGGSLGQRAMVQSYPVLAFPFCALIAATLKSNILMKGLFFAVGSLFTLMSLWFTHHAHKGGLLHVGQMTGPYYWKTLLTQEHNLEDLKLLDGVEKLFDGEKDNERSVYENANLELTLNQEQQFSEEILIDVSEMNKKADWINVSADFKISQKEWNFWTMTQFIVEFRNGTEVVQQNMIRVQRQMNDNQSKNLNIPIPRPSRFYDGMVVKFWNAEGSKEIIIKNLKVETFDEV